MRRLFQQFQYLVGAREVHTLRQPYQTDLVSALTRHHAQFSRKIVGLIGGDDCLLVEVGISLAHALHPVADQHIRTFLKEHLTPFFHKVETYGRMVAAHLGCLDGREGEMQVGMLPFSQHRGIAQQIAGKSQRYCQFSTTLWTAEHQCMRHTILLNHLHQTVPYILLTYHFTI